MFGEGNNQPGLTIWQADKSVLVVCRTGVLRNQGGENKGDFRRKQRTCGPLSKIFLSSPGTEGALLTQGSTPVVHEVPRIHSRRTCPSNDYTRTPWGRLRRGPRFRLLQVRCLPWPAELTSGHTLRAVPFIELPSLWTGPYSRNTRQRLGSEPTPTVDFPLFIIAGHGTGTLLPPSLRPSPDIGPVNVVRFRVGRNVTSSFISARTTATPGRHTWYVSRDKGVYTICMWPPHVLLKSTMHLIETKR